MMSMELFKEQQAAQAAGFLRSLGNPHRLMIICHLVGKELSVGELHQHFDLSASAFSQHLAVLRKEGLVKTRKDAQTIYYSIADPDTEKFLALLKDKFCPDY
ncbi:Biofilm growth-associated repressor [Saliniradius amylolyticus]|uniref:Biofilm growth-associated repressor n=2 Tax=Saliniradius amylolyticus TaxID=2183582 RepID=A0A2S2E691_9ALTE|nr:Biofilm growth-associated repressor [Saliniradius amylolyticus]